MPDKIIIEADIPDALQDDFREMLLKVPEQKNLGVLVAFVFMAGANAQKRHGALEIEHERRLSDAEGSRAVMLARHRRELVDLGRAVADKLNEALGSTSERIVRFRVEQANELAVKFYQHLPNSPEGAPATAAANDGTKP